MVDLTAITTTIDRSAHKVLVVDDTAATRYSTARLLRAAGFQTVEAGSGTAALARAATDGISAMVLDVHLPDVDGFEVCRRIRGNPATSLLPVVHLSAAYIKNEDQVTGLNSGADAYMIHPVEPALLVATLQALIRARTAEIQLRQSEQRFRAIYDQAQSGIAVLDPSGRLLEGNPALLRMLRMRADEIKGRLLSDLAPPEWTAFVETQFGAGSKAQAWRGEFPLRDSSGSQVHLDWSVSGLVESGVRIAVAIDVSERHELEMCRLELLEREQAARSVAERHNRTKDDFIAILSHELRTPLNAILGWVHVLQRQGLGEEKVRGLEAIERSVKTQARIISDILDVSRINAGKMRLERDEIDLAEVVNASLASVANLAAAKRITIAKHLDPHVRRAWVDAARVQQILWNLMTNAIKFSPEGSRVEVGLHQQGSGIELLVRDYGQGISPEFLPHLFDRFTQSDAPANRRHGGLGLGLSIVKHLVDLHGGTVMAESRGAGEGTCMRVWLPARQAGGDVDRRGDRDTASADGSSFHDVQGIRVLVVEDDEDALAMLKIVLTEHGAIVTTATSFDEALAVLDRDWPDVLVSDIGLPGRDGLDLIRHVKQRLSTTGPLPAIAVTAFTRAEDRQRALDAGFDLHLAKPFAPHILLEAIQSLTRRAAHT